MKTIWTNLKGSHLLVEGDLRTVVEDNERLFGRNRGAWAYQAGLPLHC